MNLLYESNIIFCYNIACMKQNIFIMKIIFYALILAFDLFRLDFLILLASFPHIFYLHQSTFCRYIKMFFVFLHSLDFHALFYSKLAKNTNSLLRNIERKKVSFEMDQSVFGRTIGNNKINSIRFQNSL